MLLTHYAEGNEHVYSLRGCLKMSDMVIGNEHIAKYTREEYKSAVSRLSEMHSLIELLPYGCVYRVSYPFGETFVGNRSARDVYSRFVPPCGVDRPCNLCRELLAATSKH